MRVRRATWLSALALSCTATPPLTPVVEDSGQPLPDTGGGGVVQSDPGWTLGEVSACPSPVAASWTNASDLLDRSLPVQGRPQHGGLVVTPHQDTWLIASTLGLRDLAAWTLTGAVTSLPASGRPSIHAVAQDIDGDGGLDLVTMGDHLEVRWDWTTLSSSPVLLSEAAEWTNYQDVAVADMDGDGQTEMLVGVWRDTWAGLERWSTTTRGQEQVQERGTELFETGLVFDQLILDFNGDAAPDVYMCNDHGSAHGGNELFLNDGAGGLVAGTPPGAGVVLDCMSVSAGDVNRDGRLDLLMSGLAQTSLLIAEGDGYVDVARAWGIEMPWLENMGWGTDIADLDNDGLPDLIVNRSGFSPTDAGTAAPDVLRQSAPGVLVEDPWGLAPPRSTRNTITVDMNRDGVLDVVYVMLDAAPEVYLSSGCTADAWLEIDAPEGSIATVEAGGQVWALPVTSQPGFGASRPTQAHFGLGTAQVVDKVSLAVPWRTEPVELAGPIDVRQRLRWRPDSASAR